MARGVSGARTDSDAGRASGVPDRPTPDGLLSSAFDEQRCNRREPDNEEDDDQEKGQPRLNVAASRSVVGEPFEVPAVSEHRRRHLIDPEEIHPGMHAKDLGLFQLEPVSAVRSDIESEHTPTAG